MGCAIYSKGRGTDAAAARERAFLIKGVNAFCRGLWVCSNFGKTERAFLLSYPVSPIKKGIAFFAPFVLLGVGAIRQNVGTPKKRVKK